MNSQNSVRDQRRKEKLNEMHGLKIRLCHVGDASHQREKEKWKKLFQHLFDDMIDLLTHERVTSSLLLFFFFFFLLFLRRRCCCCFRFDWEFIFLDRRIELVRWDSVAVTRNTNSDGRLVFVAILYILEDDITLYILCVIYCICSILILAKSVVQIYIQQLQNSIRSNPRHVVVAAFLRENNRRPWHTREYIPFVSVVNHSSDVSVSHVSKSPFICAEWRTCSFPTHKLRSIPFIHFVCVCYL